MASIATIRDGLKTRLATISGLRTYDTVPDSFSVPCAIVYPDDPYVDYEEAMGQGLARFLFLVRVYVATVSDRSAQDKLDGYASTSGASSVYEAIDGDSTLGGAVSDCHVTRARVVSLEAPDNVRYLGVEFAVEAIAT